MGFREDEDRQLADLFSEITRRLDQLEANACRLCGTDVDLRGLVAGQTILFDGTTWRPGTN